MVEQGMKRVRTCIGCGRRSDKMELLRIVRSATGLVSFDPEGNKPGRGAYVCSARCFSEALEKRKVSRALRCDMSKLDAEDIASKIEEALAGAKAR